MIASYLIALILSSCGLYLIHRFSRMAHLENQLEVHLQTEKLSIEHCYRLVDHFASYKPGACQSCAQKHSPIDFISIANLRPRCSQRSLKSSITAELILFTIIYLFYCKFGLGVTFTVYSLMTFLFFMITVIDFRYYIIPDELNIAGVILGVCVGMFADFIRLTDASSNSILLNSLANFSTFNSIFGLLLSSGVLLCIAHLTSVYLQRDAMGGGDIKLTAFIGSILGYKATLLALALSSVLGSIFGLITMFKSKIIEGNKGYTMIAFGPYIILATLIVMYFGEDTIIRHYESFSMQWVHGYIVQ